jgi:hypothetical protein
MAFQSGDKSIVQAGKTNKTPAPVTKESASDARSSSFGRESYGANAWNGRVSDDPGKRTRAALTVNNDDSDPVLAAVRQKGTANNDSLASLGNKQERTVSDTPYKTAFGHRNRNDDANPKIPGALPDDPGGAPVMQPE